MIDEKLNLNEIAIFLGTLSDTQLKILEHIIRSKTLRNLDMAVLLEQFKRVTCKEEK